MDEFQTRLTNADPFQSWWPIIVAVVFGVAMTIRYVCIRLHQRTNFENEFNSRNFMGGQNSPSTNEINGQIVIVTGGMFFFS